MLCPYCGIFNPTGTQYCSGCKKDMTVPPPPGEEYVNTRAFNPNAFATGNKHRRRGLFEGVSIPFIDKLKRKYEDLPGEQKTKIFLLVSGIILIILLFGIVVTCNSLDLCTRCSSMIDSCGKEEIIEAPPKVDLKLGLVGVEAESYRYSSFYGVWDLKDGDETIAFNPNLTFTRTGTVGGTFEYDESSNRLYFAYDDENDTYENFNVWFFDNYMMLGYEVKEYTRGLLGSGFEGTWTDTDNEQIMLGSGTTWGPAGQADKLGYYAASWRYEGNLFYYTDYGNMLVAVSGSDLALVSGTDITASTERCYAFSLDGDTLRLISGTIYVKRPTKTELYGSASDSDVSASDTSASDISSIDSES